MSTRASLGSRGVMRGKRMRFGEIACVTSGRFASAGRTWNHGLGRCLPETMCTNRASDTPVASPTVRTALARECVRMSRRGLFPRVRVNDARE
jgi:hypothetical protein